MLYSLFVFVILFHSKYIIHHVLSALFEISGSFEGRIEVGVGLYLGGPYTVYSNEFDVTLIGQTLKEKSEPSTLSFHVVLYYSSRITTSFINPEWGILGRALNF